MGRRWCCRPARGLGQAEVHRDSSTHPLVRLEPWGREDIALLERCVGEESMMRHLGGAESTEKIAERQGRYEQPGSGQFKIVQQAGGEGVGWVGYWDRECDGQRIYEIGWAVIPAFQGRGLAAAAAREVIAVAREEARRRFVHAYPAVENAASNAICRKLGFALLGPCELEYPPGSSMRCNDWRLDLLAAR
jgi:RimJ/RimL family protein N-acetyltransferase